MGATAAPTNFHGGGTKAAPAAEGRFARWQRRGRAAKAATADAPKDRQAAAKREASIAGDLEKRRRANRFPTIVAEGQRAATPLVQQSILSEQVVAAKRLQLKGLKATIEGRLGRGTTRRSTSRTR